MAFIYNPTLSVWVITSCNRSENPIYFNIKFRNFNNYLRPN